MDKNLTQSSDFFNQIERGNTIWTDHGFSIAEDFGVLSKQSSLVRIHVERVIGLMNNKYLIRASSYLSTEAQGRYSS